MGIVAVDSARALPPPLAGEGGEGAAACSVLVASPSLSLQPKSDFSDFGQPKNAEIGQARFRMQAGEGAQAPERYPVLRFSRIIPSCATEAISVPSAAKIIPRAKPRAPAAFGLSCA